MEISAKQVMELRQATGMPMMKCKHALKEAECDFEKAVEILRKEGMKTAERRAGRATGEGLIGVRIADDLKSGTMVQLLCETEPVKNTPMFRAFVDKLVDHADRGKPADASELLTQPWEGEEGETVDEALRALIALIGENMVIQRVACFQLDNSGVVGSYVHLDDKQGALVAIEGEGEDLAETAKELGQHIVFAKPQVLSREDVSAEDVEKELTFLREQVAEDPKMAGKPEKAVEGIIQGRLSKNFYGERVLAEQAWYKDTGKKVSAVLSERGVEVRNFALFRPGA